ncbi:MAG: hypothetical protein HJJLKODD_00948 [Phycisphaerae bacterium]|nr:hypothetical protein [Phycisphaerae bacterium]
MCARMLTLAAGLVIALYFASPRLQAQDPHDNDRMQDPAAAKPGRDERPTDVSTSDSGVKLLYRFEGKWKIDEDYPADGDQPASKGKGDASYTKELGDLYVMGEYRSRNKDRNMALEGHAVMTYNQELGQYRYWWFNNYNSGQEFSGEYDANTQTLVFTAIGADGDEDTSQPQHKYKFDSADKITFTIENKPGEEDSPSTPLVTVLYERKGSASKSKAEESTEGQSPSTPSTTRRQSM